MDIITIILTKLSNMQNMSDIQRLRNSSQTLMASASTQNTFNQCFGSQLTCCSAVHKWYLSWVTNMHTTINIMFQHKSVFKYPNLQLHIIPKLTFQKRYSTLSVKLLRKLCLPFFNMCYRLFWVHIWPAVQPFECT